VDGSDVWSDSYATAQATTQPPVLTVTGVLPIQGTQGKTLRNVAITGTNLTGATLVSFGTGITTTSFRVSSATKITATIAVSGNATPALRSISVTKPAGTGTGINLFTVLQAPAPTVTRASPFKGIQGRTYNISIGGTEFIKGFTQADFGTGITVNSCTVSSARSMRANITIADNATPGLRNVSATTPGGTGTGNNQFTVKQAPPTVTGVLPIQGAKGQILNGVIITGTHLTGATAVSFGTRITVTGFTVDSDTQITADITIALTATTGSRTVTVTAPGGTGRLSRGFAVIP
jgi:hypothetical protein